MEKDRLGDMPSGIKTYIVMYRANGGGRSEPLREFTIGRHGPLTPDEARSLARRIIDKHCVVWYTTNHDQKLRR